MVQEPNKATRALGRLGYRLSRWTYTDEGYFVPKPSVFGGYMFRLLVDCAGNKTKVEFESFT